MITYHIAFYTSPSADKVGYRWMWADPDIPEGMPERLYSALKKPLTTSADPSMLNGGVISLGDQWCAVFRWVDAGRDAAGRSGKLGLVAAFLRRDQLAGLDLLSVLNTTVFVSPPEERPVSTAVPIPRFPALQPSMNPEPGIKRELPGLHSYPELLAIAAAFSGGRFLLETERGLRGEVCRLSTYSGDPQPRPSEGPARALSGGAQQAYAGPISDRKMPREVATVPGASNTGIKGRYAIIAGLVLALALIAAIRHIQRSASSRGDAHNSTASDGAPILGATDPSIFPKESKAKSSEKSTPVKLSHRVDGEAEFIDVSIPVNVREMQTFKDTIKLKIDGKEYEVFVVGKTWQKLSDK